MLSNSGKFTDRNPGVRAAGLLQGDGDHIPACLDTLYLYQRSIPDPIRRMQANRDPGPGEAKSMIRTYDNIGHVTSMVHGTPGFRDGDSVGNTVQPQPTTFFQQYILNDQERVYNSRQRKPLGRAPDYELGVGVGQETTYGRVNEVGEPAGTVINPPLSGTEVEVKAMEGLDLYRRSHLKTLPGEQKDHGYAWGESGQPGVFGIPTPHDNRGTMTRRTMTWQGSRHEISQRQADYADRFKPKLGEVLDPIRDTMKVDENHTFGLIGVPDEYGAGDLLHNRPANQWFKTQAESAGVVQMIRGQLKKANFISFEDLRASIVRYDGSQTGLVDVADVLRMCAALHFPVDPHLLNDVIAKCDPAGDGNIDYVKFLRLVNWKTPLSDTNGNDCKENRVDLTQQIDKTYRPYQTSGSVINAVASQVSTRQQPSLGVPTIRTDIPAPRVRKVGDRVNYGEQSDAYGLLFPSIYTSHGVTERDLFQVREKKDLEGVLKTIAPGLTSDDFDRVYEMAAGYDAEGGVSVDSLMFAYKQSRGKSTS